MTQPVARNGSILMTGSTVGFDPDRTADADQCIARVTQKSGKPWEIGERLVITEPQWITDRSSARHDFMTCDGSGRSASTCGIARLCILLRDCVLPRRADAALMVTNGGAR